MNKQTKEINKLNNILDKQISDTNQGVFTDMICYLRASELSEYDIEIVRQDLTEMVLSAQERGEDIKKVIGGDYRGFCDTIIDSFPPKSLKQRFIDFLDIVCLQLAILIAINTAIAKESFLIIMNILDGKPVSYDINFTTGSVASILIIVVMANLLVKTICKNTFESILHNKLVLFAIFATLTIFIQVIVFYGRTVLFTTNVFVSAFLALALFGIHKLLEKNL